MGIHDDVVSSGFRTLSVNSSHPRSVPSLGVRTRQGKLGFFISTVVDMLCPRSLCVGAHMSLSGHHVDTSRKKGGAQLGQLGGVMWKTSSNKFLPCDVSGCPDTISLIIVEHGPCTVSVLVGCSRSPSGSVTRQSQSSTNSRDARANRCVLHPV